MTFTKYEAPYPHWYFYQSKTGDWLRIVPERGGLITEWFCNGQQMLYFDQSRFINTSKSVRGGIPILFPICGNLPGNILPLFDTEYRIRQHGFARDLPWKIKQLNDKTGVLLSLTDSSSTHDLFPFAFLLEMEARPLFNELVINIRIYNKGNQPMPFSFGLHPYFNVNDLDAVFIDGLPRTCLDHLKMRQCSTSEQCKQLSKGVDFLIEPEGSNISFVDKINGKRVRLIHDAPMDLIVIWTEPPRKMICLEPWTGPRNSLVSGDRRLILKPGCMQALTCRYVCS